MTDDADTKTIDLPLAPQTQDQTTDRPDPLADIRQQVLTGAEAAAAKLASDVAILEVGQLVGITDFFLIFSTSNDRQLGSAVDEAERKLKEDHGRRPIGREGTKENGWIVLDYGDFVVHAFTTAQREVYDLERLWRDAPRVPFADPAQPGD